MTYIFRPKSLSFALAERAYLQVPNDFQVGYATAFTSFGRSRESYCLAAY